MNKNNKNELISETQIENQAIEARRAYIGELVEKEKQIATLPYYDEYPRMGYNKFFNCKTLAARMITYTTILAFLTSYFAPRIKYGIDPSLTVRLHIRTDLFKKCISLYFLLVCSQSRTICITFSLLSKYKPT
jgi:hypothetical protein